MLKLITSSSRFSRLLARRQTKLFCRNFLSQAYYCNEVWEQRLNNPVLQKINLQEFYYDLDQKYQKTNTISAIDVDLFVNSVRDDTYFEEMLDLVHKLRLTAEASNILESTPHAVIRSLMQYQKHDELLNALDDRLNYGLFVDHYTANLLLDLYWKNKDYLSGARIASQLMLQEDVDHQLSSSLSLLHCYKFLQNPVGWLEPEKPQEPEEEVKVRVKYLRNQYDDDHFDLKDPLKIVGKTIMVITKGSHNIIDKSFYVVGLMLYDKTEKATDFLKNVQDPFCKEIIELLTEDKRIDVNTQSMDVETNLQERVKKAEREIAERDIAKQCELLSNWELERKQALEKQLERIDKDVRLKNIEQLEKDLKQREQKLWFFDNEEQIELGIEAKRVYYPKRWFGRKKKPRKIDEDYIPPEITRQKPN